jgi:nicotinamidase-related amidase
VDVLVIIDMQEGLLLGGEKYELPSVVERINRLAARVRDGDGCVVFIQHDGPPGDAFAPSSPGWPILSSIQKGPQDRIVRKTLNDAFHGTTLEAELNELGARRVLVAGWATDLCVDATVRTAAALGFRVVVVSDCHTVSARPHLDAEKVIEHHHWIWTNLISPIPVEIASEADIL